MCPICQGKLIPIVYGVITDTNLSLHKDGKIILAGYRDRYLNHPKSSCTNCFESHDIQVSI
jgi:hypothetical protein